MAGAATLVLLATAWACGGGRRSRGPESVPRRDRVQEGVASWYGKDFHGRPTASGETYDMNGLSAAHRTLPLGTRARVKNLENGREVELKINDRGPFVRGRVLDCSYGAAKALGFAGQGLARVRIEVLERGRGRPRGLPPSGEILPGTGGPPGTVLDSSFTVQVGAFLNPDNAVRLRGRLAESHPDAYVIRFRDFYRVRVGHLRTEEAAEALLGRLTESGLEGFVTRNE